VTTRDVPPDARAGDALTDVVTGALSRASLEVRLREELNRAGRSGAEFSLCLFDVDHFTSVNDAFGHLRGDQVLRQVIDRISGLLRGSDAVFRYGGDEFVLLLPDAGKAEATEVALRVVAGVGQAGFDGDPPLQVSISLGVACFPADAADGAGLVAVADRRSYLAKRRGRGCVASDDAASGVVEAASGLVGRAAATGAVQEFLAGLTGVGPGVLRVGGPRGGGHTRFVAEIVKIAELQGFDVLLVGGHPVLASGPEPRQHAATGVLVVADGESSWSMALGLARERVGTAPTVGLVLAGPSGMPGLADAALPLRAVVELTRWSVAAVRVWLRTRLRGEPSAALIDLVVDRSDGLPARAERTLGRLLDGGALQPAADGGWTLAGPDPTRQRGQRPLPLPLTELVGRGCEIDQIIGLLAVERLVTLAGPGGMGKTRLALAVAGEVEDRFDDGVFFVPLAEATATGHVDSAVAQALEVAQVADRPLSQTITEHLGARNLLLVLDNFEQVTAAAVQVADWLTAAPGLTVLVTSRERLRLTIERVYAVPGLTLPELATLPRDPGAVASAVARSSALDLFAARGRRVAYDFTLTVADLHAVAELCHRLDGIPLAIELAAARLDTMSPQGLLAGLSERLDLLAEGPVDVPARQRTMRAAIGWGYELLGPADRTLFAALGVFAGGCRTDAVEAVSPASRLPERLAGLVDKNLLQVRTDPDGGPRFVMLETIRSYAAERLAADPSADAVHARHAAHFAALADQAVASLLGPEQSAAHDLIAQEQHNVRAALAWTLANDEGEVAARISVGIWRFWATRGHSVEGREWITRVLAKHGPLPPALQARLLYAAGSAATDQGDVGAAEALLQRSLAGARAIDERTVMAQSLRMLGEIRTMAGKYEQARRLHEESLALARAESDPYGIACALGDLGDIAIRLGNLDAARALVSESLALFRTIGHTIAALCCLLSLGEVLLFQGDPAGARPQFEDSLVLSREVGDVSSEAWALHHLGVVADLDGDAAEAARLFAGALSLRYQTQERPTIADSLEGLAGVTIAGDPVFAARLFGAAAGLRDRYQLPRPPVWQGRWDTHMSRLRLAFDNGALDAAARAAAWVAGAAASVDDVVAAALGPGPVA
jgi:diguanylate cyclase (GGDEF)-like protein